VSRVVRHQLSLGPHPGHRAPTEHKHPRPLTRPNPSPNPPPIHNIGPPTPIAKPQYNDGLGPVTSRRPQPPPRSTPVHDLAPPQYNHHTPQTQPHQRTVTVDNQPRAPRNCRRPMRGWQPGAGGQAVSREPGATPIPQRPCGQPRSRAPELSVLHGRLATGGRRPTPLERRTPRVTDPAASLWTTSLARSGTVGAPWEAGNRGPEAKPLRTGAWAHAADPPIRGPSPISTPPVRGAQPSRTAWPIRTALPTRCCQPSNRGDARPQPAARSPQPAARSPQPAARSPQPPRKRPPTVRLVTHGQDSPPSPARRPRGSPGDPRSNQSPKARPPRSLLAEPRGQPVDNSRPRARNCRSPVRPWNRGPEATPEGVSPSRTASAAARQAPRPARSST
jgi:hypothetical protein